MRGEEGLGEGFWRGEGGRGSRKKPPPPTVSGRKGQRKFSSINADESLRPRAKENFSPENPTENLLLDHTFEEEEGGGGGVEGGEGWKGAGGLGGGGGSSYDCQAFQYIPDPHPAPVLVCFGQLPAGTHTAQ